MQLDYQTPMRKRFRVLFILLPVVGLLITQWIWWSKQKYMSKTSPSYIENRDLVDSTVTSGEYVILRDWCLAEDYVYYEKGSEKTYYYAVNSCDSPNVGIPSIIIELDEERHQKIDQDQLSAVWELPKLFEGKLVKGIPGLEDKEDYMARHLHVDMSTAWTLYSGVTPASVRAGAENSIIVVLVLTGIAFIVLVVARKFALDKARSDEAKVRFYLEQMEKKDQE